MSNRRALHFVFKVADRPATIEFYRDLLGMQILRHEEFESGCKASCNGPYDGKWSKTMVGYGPEDDNLVVELTYNYNIGSYNLGNDFRGLTVQSTVAFDRAQNDPEKWGSQVEAESGKVFVLAPGGYKFYLEKSTTGSTLSKVTLASSCIEKSKEYWSDLLGMQVLDKTSDRLLMCFDSNQAQLELLPTPNGDPVDHATAFGRIAFSLPTDDLPGLQKLVEEKKGTILTRLVSLDTPGKATVSVVILGDPDGHEICFVGDESFRQLSQVDPDAQDLLNKGMENDKSNEWYSKKGKVKDSV